MYADFWQLLPFSPSADGPPVVAHYDISDTNSDPEVVNVDNLLAAAVVQEHNNSLGNQDSGSTWRTRGLIEELSADTGLLKFPSSGGHSFQHLGHCLCLLSFRHFCNLYGFKSTLYGLCNKEEYRSLLKISGIYSNIQLVKNGKGSCNVFFWN